MFKNKIKHVELYQKAKETRPFQSKIFQHVLKYLRQILDQAHKWSHITPSAQTERTEHFQSRPLMLPHRANDMFIHINMHVYVCHPQCSDCKSSVCPVCTRWKLQGRSATNLVKTPNRILKVPGVPEVRGISLKSPPIFQ